MSTDTIQTLPELFELRLEDPLVELNPDTIRHYHRSLRQFGEYLGRIPTAKDLNTIAIMGFAKATLEAGLRPETANSRIKQLRALWDWAGREQLVEKLPPRKMKLYADRTVPDSWKPHELQALFTAAQKQTGWIGPHKASVWWLAVLWIFYNTGERFGAIWKITPDMVDLQEGTLTVPASVRKGARIPMKWLLTPQCLDALEEILDRSEELLLTLPWTKPQSLYRHYRQLVEDAGLSYDRRQGLQKMRRTVASSIAIRGGDPSTWLGHAPKSIAAEHYLDRWSIQVARQEVWPIDHFDPNVDNPAKREPVGATKTRRKISKRRRA